NEPTEPDQVALAAAIDALRQARRRVIVAGGGVIASGAGEALLELARRLGAPVVTTVNGRGAISERDPLVIGNYYQSRGLATSLESADLTLAVGTRFQAGVDGANLRLKPPGKLVHVDVDPGTIGRAHPAIVAVAADARRTLEAIVSGLGVTSPNDA